MQGELQLAGLDVQLLGLNQIGAEPGNVGMTSGRDLPWLQETVDELVWGPWNVTYRDCVILDRDNRVVAVYNLTTHDLGDPANYAELYQIIAAAAAP